MSQPPKPSQSPNLHAGSPSRRTFLKQAGWTAAGALAAGSVESALGFGANDTIHVGCIGTGGRCQALMKSLVKVPNVKIAEVCDIWETHLEAGRKLADPAAVVEREYQRLLDRKDLDAVLIGAPDHWHVPLTIAACQAGKDVYVEKPLTHDLSEGAAVIAAKNASGRIVQVGTQQRSMPHFQKGFEIIRSGQLGTIHKVHLTWNRNVDRVRRYPGNIDPRTVDWSRFLGKVAPQPFDDYRFRNWRWFWDFGGGILTDLMVHQIDIVHWYLGLEHPLSATTVGDQFVSQGGWETPDTIQCVLKYPRELQVYFEGTFVNARHGAMLEFMGTEGTLYLDRGRYEILPERKSKLKPEEWILGTGPRGADFYDRPDGELLHLTDWVNCLRTRKAPVAPVEAGVSAAAAAHLGNLAFRTGTVAKWPETARTTQGEK